MRGADENFELIDVGRCGLEKADVFRCGLKLTLPLVNGAMGGEEVQASGVAQLDGTAAKGLGLLSIRKCHIEKDRAHFASESLNTRLPTDFLWP